MEAIPPLIPYPLEDVRHKLPPQEWQACLESWLLSVEYRLRIAKAQFSQLRLSQPVSGFQFLLSYFSSHQQPLIHAAHSPETQLSRQCYFLLKRLLLETSSDYDCSPTDLFDTLTYASSSYGSITDWRLTLKIAWKRCPVQMTTAVNTTKSDIMKYLGTKASIREASPLIHQATALVKASSEAGSLLMTGTDYLETIISAYNANPSETGAGNLKSLLTGNTYYCLRSLMADASKQSSLLLDHLYLIKSDAEHRQKSKSADGATLLSDLVCSTSFLKHLRADDSVTSSKRGQSMLNTLIEFRQHNLHHYPPKTNRRTKQQKGKQRVNPREEMHIHKAAEISQIHELFPDLPTGYILKLLDHFSDNVESVTAALLEPESLPPQLRDQSTDDVQLDLPDGHFVRDLAPHSTPPLVPQRKNVFDNDDFDNLRISSARLHKGRKEITTGSETHDQHARSKAAIMAALAAFDSDDDERDDTYDVADVGASVDNTLDTDIRSRETRISEQEVHEESLFKAWKANPELFARDSKTRMINARQDLKRETGMTDEQIEGWAIMMKKDPKAQEKMERKYADKARGFGRNQTTLASSKWQASSAEASQDEEGDAATSTLADDGKRVGQAGIRGARTWNRGRGGGGTAGAADDPRTQAARKRKEQGRGRGGVNHSRREGRAKKMGRGMGPLP